MLVLFIGKACESTIGHALTEQLFLLRVRACPIAVRFLQSAFPDTTSQHNSRVPESLFLLPARHENLKRLRLFAVNPEVFAPLGLCHWTSKREGLTPEVNELDFAEPDETAPRLLANTLLAISNLVLGNLSIAQEFCEHALMLEQSDSSRGYLLWWLGLAHLGIGQNVGEPDRFDKAIDCLKQALAVLRQVSVPSVVASILGSCRLDETLEKVVPSLAA